MDADAQMPPLAVYDFLIDEPNLAVEDALLRCLPEMEPGRQDAALDVLIRRGRDQGTLGLVSGFAQYDCDLQAKVLARSNDLYAGTRLAISDEAPEVRLSAIELIQQSGDVKLAYLLAEALRQHCPRTRAAAGEALHDLTRAYLNRRDQAVAAHLQADDLAALQRAGDYLGRTLLRAIDGWKLHFRVEVLTAAMWMGDRLSTALLDRVEATRSRLGRAVLERLRVLNDPRMAGFCLRALVSPTLRPHLVQCLSSCQDMAFIQALAAEAWLLADPHIARECSGIRRWHWLEKDPHRIATVPLQYLPGLVRLMGASGISPEDKVQAYRHLLSDGPAEVAPLVMARLTRTQGHAAADLLRALAYRRDSTLSPWARVELRRRGLWAKRIASRTVVSSPQTDESATGHPFDAYWQAFEQLDADQRRQQGRSLKTTCPDLMQRVRARLASPVTAERSLALKLTEVLELTQPLAEQIYRLSSDYEAVIRSQAISLLAHLAGPTTRRIVRRALEDPDPRVQSNAMEVMDRLSVSGRRDQLTPKLQSDHHRVRATAIACLLKMEAAEAAETLLDMLADGSGTQRISALWVVERLQLSSMLSRLYTMAQDDPDARVRRRARRVLDSLPDLVSGPALATYVEGDA